MCSAQDDFRSLSPLTHPTVASHRFIYCSPRHRDSRVESPCPVPGPSSGSWAGICQSSRAFPRTHPWRVSERGFAFPGSPSRVPRAAPRAWLCSGDLFTHSTSRGNGTRHLGVCPVPGVLLNPCPGRKQPLGICSLSWGAAGMLGLRESRGGGWSRCRYRKS